MSAASRLPSHPIYCPNDENLPPCSETIFDMVGLGGTPAGSTRGVKTCSSDQEKTKVGGKALPGPSSHMGATGAVAQPSSLEHCMAQGTQWWPVTKDHRLQPAAHIPGNSQPLQENHTGTRV